MLNCEPFLSWSFHRLISLSKIIKVSCLIVLSITYVLASKENIYTKTSKFSIDTSC